MRVTGKLEVDAFGFFQVGGDFAIDRYTDEVVIAGDDPRTAEKEATSTVTVERLTIGASNAKAFAGINGTSADRIGLLLGGDPADLNAEGNVDFGLAILSETLTGFEPTGYKPRNWTSLYATAGSVDFVGIKDLTIHADTISVEVNRPATDGSLVDYQAKPLAVMTSGGEEPSSLTLSMAAADGPLLRATGNLEIDAFGFVQVAGSFGIEKKQGTVAIADRALTKDIDESATVNVDMLLIGGSNLSAFVGVNGGLANATGLSLSGVNVGVALLNERFTKQQQDAAKAENKTLTSRNWTSLQAEVGSAAFVGVEGLTARVDTLTVGVNRSAFDGTVVDYALTADTTDPEGSRYTDLSILTGPGTDLKMTLDGSRGVLTEARVRH